MTTYGVSDYIAEHRHLERLSEALGHLISGLYKSLHVFELREVRLTPEGLLCGQCGATGGQDFRHKRTCPFAVLDKARADKALSETFSPPAFWLQPATPEVDNPHGFAYLGPEGDATDGDTGAD